MAMIVNDTELADHLRAQRVAAGADRWDEVWDGAYMLMPLPDDEHQDLVGALVSRLRTIIGRPRLGSVHPGARVSDRDDWARNYRCPDVAVFLEGTAAIDQGTHWLGGPDFAVEIITKNDRTREKLAFYARVRVRELLLVDRDP